MLRVTSYTNEKRFISRLNFVTHYGNLQSWYKTELNGVIYYTLEYIN